MRGIFGESFHEWLRGGLLQKRPPIRPNRPSPPLGRLTAAPRGVALDPARSRYSASLQGIKDGPRRRGEWGRQSPTAAWLGPFRSHFRAQRRTDGHGASAGDPSTLMFSFSGQGRSTFGASTRKRPAARSDDANPVPDRPKKTTGLLGRPAISAPARPGIFCSSSGVT
jgi:hypothetical protein